MDGYLSSLKLQPFRVGQISRQGIVLDHKIFYLTAVLSGNIIVVVSHMWQSAGPS